MERRVAADSQGVVVEQTRLIIEHELRGVFKDGRGVHDGESTRGSQVDSEKGYSMDEVKSYGSDGEKEEVGEEEAGEWEEEIALPTLRVSED
jgi:hypothetical protein